MSTKAEETVEKVTLKLEKGDDELLRLLRQMVTQANGMVDQDLEQEAFLKMLEVFRGRADIRNPRGLMRKIVHDTVVDAWRLRKRTYASSIDEYLESTARTTPHIEEDIDNRRRLGLLRESILDLGCDIRGPVYLFYIEHYRIDTIVQSLGKSRSAIKMALYRGRNQLNRMLSGSGPST